MFHCFSVDFRRFRKSCMPQCDNIWISMLPLHDYNDRFKIKTIYCEFGIDSSQTGEKFKTIELKLHGNGNEGCFTFLWSLTYKINQTESAIFMFFCNNCCSGIAIFFLQIFVNCIWHCENFVNYVDLLLGFLFKL
jgi:hypothetical protein